MLKVFSYGGGVQSTAALVLAAEGAIDYRTFVFCNVGEDSENPATLAYVREYARPYAAAHGLNLIELQRRKRDGSVETLLQRLTRPGSRSIDIPVRMSNGAPGRRSCTVDFKIKLVDHWLRGAARSPLWGGALVGLGISLDEQHLFPTIRKHADLLVVQTHNAVVPLPVVSLETGHYYRPATIPPGTRSNLVRRNQQEKHLLISLLALGLDAGEQALQTMSRRSQQRYRAWLASYLRSPRGRARAL